MTDATRDALPQTTTTPPMSDRARAECVKMLLEDIAANSAQVARYSGQVPVYTDAEDIALVTINLNKARLYLNAALQSNRALHELLEQAAGQRGVAA